MMKLPKSGKRVVSFLVSGRGSNFSAVAEKIRDGEIPAVLGVCISDNPKAGVLDIAGRLNMASFVADPLGFDSREEMEKQMIRILRQYRTDLVVAAGFMRILSLHFVSLFRNRIINIHPALLPAFPGRDAQRQALEYGARVTGCTAHFIDEGIDTGPVILQSPVPVHQGDTIATLSARILREEHRILPEAVKLFCQGRLKVSGRSVLIRH